MPLYNSDSHAVQCASRYVVEIFLFLSFRLDVHKRWCSFHPHSTCLHPACLMKLIMHIFMIELSPILEHFCPMLVQIAQLGLILPRWGLILPRTPPPTSVLHSAVTIPKTSVFYTAVTNPIWQNTPSAQPKTPLFLTWTWKWAKSTTVWAKWTPTGQNVWKVGKTVLEVAKKIFIIFLPNLSSWFAGTGVQNGCLQLFLLYVFACYCLSECTKLFRVWQWLWPTGLWQHLHCQKHSTSNRHPQRY